MASFFFFFPTKPASYRFKAALKTRLFVNSNHQSVGSPAKSEIKYLQKVTFTCAKGKKKMKFSEIWRWKLEWHIFRIITDKKKLFLLYSFPCFYFFTYFFFPRQIHFLWIKSRANTTTPTNTHTHMHTLGYKWRNTFQYNFC